MIRVRKYLSILWFLWLCFACQDEESDLNQNKVYFGKFKAALSETGELQAISSRNIVMPYIGGEFGWGFKVTEMKEHGSYVNKGDTVFQMDPYTVLRYQNDQERAYAVQLAALSKLKVQQKIELAGVQAELDKEEANHALKKLDLDKYKFESENIQTKKKLEFQQSEIRLTKAQKLLERRKYIQQKEFHIQKIKIEKIKSNIEKAGQAFQKLSIVAPEEGIMQVHKSYRSKEMIKVGDEVYQTHLLATLPNLNAMKVHTTIHEKDIRKVKIGQSVKIRLDAQPEDQYNGVVSHIGKLSREKKSNNKVKIFDIEVSIVEKNTKLKPGMTVHCMIDYGPQEDHFFVKNDCILRSNGQYYVFAKAGLTTKKLPVRIGASNSTHTTIFGDLEKGMDVVPIDENNL